MCDAPDGDEHRLPKRLMQSRLDDLWGLNGADSVRSTTVEVRTPKRRKRASSGANSGLQQLRLDAVWQNAAEPVSMPSATRVPTVEPDTGSMTAPIRTSSVQFQPDTIRSAIGNSDGAEIVSNELDGLTATRDRSLRSSPPLNWPSDEVEFISEFHNPSAIRFGHVPPFQTCSCDDVCRTTSCVNARSNVFCSRNCCKYKGFCGNGLQIHYDLRLAENDSTFGFGVYTTEAIDAGVVIGEYLGEIKLLEPEQVRQNQGYLLRMKADPRLRKGDSGSAFIDAFKFGNVTRFFNHSCRASTKFEEMCNGSRHTIVVVTVRDIEAGEQITVDYKGMLWFTCRCGESNCVSLKTDTN